MWIKRFVRHDRRADYTGFGDQPGVAARKKRLLCCLPKAGLSHHPVGDLGERLLGLDIIDSQKPA